MVTRFSWKREAVSALGRYPRLYRYAIKLRPNLRAKLVCPDTDIVIEGFPRSANSFTEAAFRRAQPDAVKTADHLHSPAQVLLASKMHIPAIVLVRPPRDVISSFLVYDPRVGAAQTLRLYLRFYRVLIPNTNSFVIAPFELATSRLDKIVAEVNSRFSTTFALPVLTESEVSAIFNEIEKRSRERYEGNVNENRVSRPSSKRERLKVQMTDLLASVTCRRLLLQAESLFQPIVDLVEIQRTSGSAVSHDGR